MTPPKYAAGTQWPNSDGVVLVAHLAEPFFVASVETVDVRLHLHVWPMPANPESFEFRQQMQEVAKCYGVEHGDMAPGDTERMDISWSFLESPAGYPAMVLLDNSQGEWSGVLRIGSAEAVDLWTANEDLDEVSFVSSLKPNRSTPPAEGVEETVRDFLSQYAAKMVS